MQALTPMIHVPDVRATAAWYEGIGFVLVRANEKSGELNWALRSFRGSDLMLNTDGTTSHAPRPEVDLYLQVDGVDALFREMKDRVEIVEPPHDTPYGIREFKSSGT
jgi:hypothetical protein